MAVFGLFNLGLLTFSCICLAALYTENSNLGVEILKKVCSWFAKYLLGCLVVVGAYVAIETCITWIWCRRPGVPEQADIEAQIGHPVAEKTLPASLGAL
jgi:hypothetical protein